MSCDLNFDSGLHFEDVSPFLEFLPLEYSSGFDAQGFEDVVWDFGNSNNNNDLQNIDSDGLFDNIMVPDLNVLDTQSSLDVAGDGFLEQEQPLLTVNSTLIEQPSTSTSSTPNPPSTTTTNKSPSSTSAIPGTSTFSLHPSPSASSSSSSSRKRKSSPEEEDSAVTLKRQRNTLAARKYRQKRLDRISELEEALAAMTNERDDMRLQLARREAEVDALREMLGKK
ncbi:gaf domain nucleotide-binding [Fusarium longipes]|uniref:Gaf domain nucleotide-binding n=1 Tax=Fusarium longipes TaxID=694270 RepID=A0A395T2N3_9HYPO|nr:gaf domain nucleotide-binding [Fusarium longipes]